MTPAAIIREAAADGVSLELSQAGTVKATGDQAAVSRWLPILRAILAALAPPAADLIQAHLDDVQDLAVYPEERRQSDDAAAELARLSAIRQQLARAPSPRHVG